MDASCKIQGSIHVLLCLIQKSMCPGFWVHITSSHNNLNFIFTKIAIELPDTLNGLLKGDATLYFQGEVFNIRRNFRRNFTIICAA